MKFNLLEKLAVMKALDELIQMDEKIQPGEIDYMEQLADAMDIDISMIMEARDSEAAEAIAVLKVMPSDKQQTLIRLMTEAANSDGEVDEKEIRFIYRLFLPAGMGPKI